MTWFLCSTHFCRPLRLAFGTWKPDLCLILILCISNFVSKFPTLSAARVFNSWSVRLCYVAHAHILKSCIYCKKQCNSSGGYVYHLCIFYVWLADHSTITVVVFYQKRWDAPGLQWKTVIGILKFLKELPITDFSIHLAWI